MAINYARHNNFNCLWLGVWQKNSAAIKFYNKFDFETIGTKLFKIGNKITEDFIMLLKV